MLSSPVMTFKRSVGLFITVSFSSWPLLDCLSDPGSTLSSQTSLQSDACSAVLWEFADKIHNQFQPLHRDRVWYYDDPGQRQSLRVASGATAPSPALEGAPRFRTNIIWKIWNFIWKMTIIISLLGQRHCHHVVISFKKNRCPQTGLWPRTVMVSPRPHLLLTPFLILVDSRLYLCHFRGGCCRA